MRTEATFDGFSSITFDALRMRAHVSRRHKTAGVFRLAYPPALSGESIGVLMRKSDGCLDWQSYKDGIPCPMPIFEVVCTMI